MSEPLDRFFEHYYRARPVNATFTGIHEYDRLLPDWSRSGLQDLCDEMREIDAALAAVGHEPLPDAAHAIDVVLARDFLAIQLAENDSTHGMRRNPSLWTGEAVMGVAGLMLRDFDQLGQRFDAATARLQAIPEFLSDARDALASAAIPVAWRDKAVRECQGGAILFSRGVDLWIASARGRVDGGRLRAAATAAHDALLLFAEWLGLKERAAADAIGCGPELYALLLARGHHCTKSASELLVQARSVFQRERAKLHEMARELAGSFTAAQEKVATNHPAPDDYLAAMDRTWTESRRAGADVVTWPEWPIRYVPYPRWIEEAAPYLYLLHYRSPAPFDQYDIHDYVVPRLPTDGTDRFLRSWNHSVIKLNHVVHHGAIGHHVQNWNAYHRAKSRIGQVAAVDCANRIGMFGGGTVAEGWACYVTQLMDELGYLDPLDRFAEQHTRVRFMARAIVDIELHHGSMTLDDGIRFYSEEVGMGADAARGEAVRNSMYPCAATMYWLGTDGILKLRDDVRRARGSDWSLKAFHDDFLQYGSIPVPIIAEMMLKAQPQVTSPT
ncbi:MAG TPA: DUF885 family protein [Gemmatimonadaceae bacterium]|nr:DUF885 family protein [Gemmatimonadaceae bacterium]